MSIQIEPQDKKLSKRILVCILNWNGLHFLKAVLPSLLQTEYSNVDFLVIDNASNDESAEFVSCFYPRVRVIRNTRNLMWAGGNNVGVEIALREGHDFIMLANNDILVDPRWATVGLAVAESSSRIGIIGYNVIGEHSKVDIDIWHRALKEFSKLVVKDDPSISGCFMLVRRDVFEAVGLFDEIYQLYGEENDFIFRAIRAGFRAVRCNLPIFHHSEGTAIKFPFFSAYMSTRNELRFYVKQHRIGFWGMMKWFFHRMVIACDVCKSVDNEDSCRRRMHPSKNVFVNCFIVLRSLLWNICQYRESRLAGLTDEHRCASFKKRFSIADRD